MKVLGTGVLLTVVVTAILWAVWGRGAILGGVSFGLLATVIQIVAVAIVRPVLSAPFAKFLARWGMGMGLRLLGVVAFVVAVVVNRELFPPLPVACGYLGVLVPLLFMEIRFLR
ncbi:MAG: hypothetical protein GTN62_03120 [Gemmatimonadales bacterium]|nr:hypothetical protein [Gemmatimonadales bacterium]NIN49091.1 hypothetical protein [Gemmatimonadales bacterium]NIP06555.1 hypothetical protein [Gemmatimonadales bacterium]NIR00252.1 hypothetical protein [Gemmatimonadales bacterium]NIS64585.1 hypothetical protein [Gemmatimonadales bacterium]